MTDPERPPSLSILFGYGPVLLLPILGLLAWSIHGPAAGFALGAGQLWAATILIFLAGVRRGLSFSTIGGPRPIQIVTTLWLFALGAAALATPWITAYCILILGYGSIALLDPRAADRGEVPAHFRRLRPLQMALALAGLATLLLRAASL